MACVVYGGEFMAQVIVHPCELGSTNVGFKSDLDIDPHFSWG